MAELRATGQFEDMSLATDEDEHSLELHLPYIRHIFAGLDIALVPVLVGALSTAAEAAYGRLLAPHLARPDTLLVVDSMNYIKGFRYQLYCAAREHKLRVCTVSLLVLVLVVSFSIGGTRGADARARTCAYMQVFVAAPPDRCKAWNDARLAAGEPAYAPET